MSDPHLENTDIVLGIGHLTNFMFGYSMLTRNTPYRRTTQLKLVVFTQH